MVAAAPKLEVRSVGPDSFDDVYPLLELFRNRKMSREDWRRMLFSYPWADDRERGYAVYADGAAVGFMGTIFSTRRIDGRDELFCNTSSWIVREEYRSASILLLKPILAQRDCTIVNLTPTQRSYDIFAKLGFKPLEHEKLLMLPIASPASFAGGSFASDPDEFAAELSESERTLRAELASCTRLRHVFLRRGGRSCYLIAAPLRVKRVPLAELLYIGEPGFLFENRALAHVALLRSMGALGIAVDRRFAGNRRVGLALARPAQRLYRPARPEIAPAMVDGLFSELMTLKI